MHNVGIIGASGYTGVELIKLLLAHPRFQLTYVADSSGGKQLFDLHPALEGTLQIPIQKADIDEIAKQCDLVFLALPHQHAMRYAKKLREKDLKVVDLSADYRLEMQTYEAHYCTHEDPAHLPESVYGLIEYYRNAIKHTSLTAVPGCYPTATLLGLLPFIPHIDTSLPIFIDAKSGLSGAGKKLSDSTHFVSINENIHAYNPIAHRHAPEIAEKIRHIHDRSCNVVFVPHLIPMTRGELVSIYATLQKPIDARQVLEKAYQDEPFVRLRATPPETKSVSGTHFCDIYASTKDNALFISVAIDNLLRGAASQALACANLMCGLEERSGLPKIAYVP